MSARSSRLAAHLGPDETIDENPTDRISSARGTASISLTGLGSTEMPRLPGKTSTICSERQEDVVDVSTSQETLTPLCQAAQGDLIRPIASSQVTSHVLCMLQSLHPRGSDPSKHYSHDSYTVLHVLSLASHVAIERRVAFESRTGALAHLLNGVDDQM